MESEEGNMKTDIDRPYQGFDALRIQAEIETADRAQSKRPTWAPAVILDGELLELCRELEFLEPDDKPVARLWAIFADPKRKGAAIRTTYSRHVLPGLRCRGFELHAGMQHNGARLRTVLMDSDGSWNIRPVTWGHSNIKKVRSIASDIDDNIASIRRSLQPTPRPGRSGRELSAGY